MALICRPVQILAFDLLINNFKSMSIEIIRKEGKRRVFAGDTVTGYRDQDQEIISN